jgi:hypothetical protein
MSARFGRPARIGNAMPAVLSGRIGSLVPAAADPHTRAITIWNGTANVAAGPIAGDLDLEDDAEGYELIDTAGNPVPHRWLGARGEPPTRLDLPRHEVPDFDGVMAHLDGDRVLGRGVLAVSMRVLRETLRVEITMGDRAVLDRADLEEMVRDAFALADDADCRRVIVTLHRACTLRMTAWVAGVPAYGYQTLLVRPRPRPKAGVRSPIAAPMAELFSDSEGEPGRGEAKSTMGALAGGDGGILPSIAQASAVPLQTQVAPCVEGVLPPSASLVTVSPAAVVLGDLKETESGDGILFRLGNEGAHAARAHVELLLAVRAAEVIDLNERPIEVLWEDEPRTNFTVAIPPRGTVTVRVRWAAEELSTETR